MNEILYSKIQSILFVANKPLSTATVAKFVESTPAETLQALHELAEIHSDTGIVLLESNGSWQFSTNPTHSSLVKNFLNIELREKLTDATVETLAIIAYRQPISKAELEAIRGVNCQYSIRSLLVRGLIQKSSQKEARGVMYETTPEFLQHLGIQNLRDLPSFEGLAEKIQLPEIKSTVSEDSGNSETVDSL
jgi:segregation and condensation protein B